jgi:hypothetical protein
MLSNRHFFWRGHSLLLLQLHVALFFDDDVWVVDFGLDSILVLCLEIMLLQLSMQLYSS